MERRHVLEPHLERRARELLAENIEQVLPRIQLLFFHALLPLLSRKRTHPESEAFQSRYGFSKHIL